MVEYYTLFEVESFMGRCYIVFDCLTRWRDDDSGAYRGRGGFGRPDDRK